MSLPDDIRAVVTGAGSGLGRAFCAELARRGGRVLAADINLAGAHETVRALAGGDALAVRCDVTKPDEVEALAVLAWERWGGVDLVINNAGVGVTGRVGDVSLADWRWQIDVNLWGVIHGCHAFVPRLRRQRGGHILNVASITGLVSHPQMAPYGATKAAVVALSESLAAELKDDGVGVTVACPSFFATNIAKAGRGSHDQAMRDKVEQLMTKSGRQAPEVARLALEAVDAGRMYAIPHPAGRWMWRAKRLAPELAVRMSAKIAARVAGEAAASS